MIDPTRELFIWGPIDGKPMYVWGFTEAFRYHPDNTHNVWPDVLEYLEGDKITIIVDHDDLYSAGERLFNYAGLQTAKKHYALWLACAQHVQEWMARPITALGTDYESWRKAERAFWVNGYLPEISNWGAERILKRMLEQRHRDHFLELFEALSAPEDLSFMQMEEKSLLRIALLHDQERERALEEHQRKYFWLRNSYGHTQVLDVAFFRDQLSKLAAHEAAAKLKEIEAYPATCRERKAELIKKYAVNDEIVRIADHMVFCIWWQDLRKQYIFMGNHVTTRFLQEASGAHGIPFDELLWYTGDELSELVRAGKRTDTSRRSQGFVIYHHGNTGIEQFEGEVARRMAAPYLHVHVEDVLQVSGTVVSRGPLVRGTARIVHTPRELSHFHNGDVLISPMTSPDFIIAMRMASAIVTDQGGMTSHAAIVSRELGKPCIVGTKAATRIIKDGDTVEVDTVSGTVRKIP